MRRYVAMPDPRVYFGHAHHRFWAEKLDEPTFVYILRAGDEQPIKIGRARDVFARIAVLQTGNPYPLRLLYVMPGGAELERLLHQRLRGHRAYGEWFTGDELDAFLPEVADLSERMVRAYDGRGQPPMVRRLGNRWLVGDEAKPAPPVGYTYKLPPPVPPDEVALRLRAAYLTR